MNIYLWWTMLNSCITFFKTVVCLALGANFRNFFTASPSSEILDGRQMIPFIREHWTGFFLPFHCGGAVYFWYIIVHIFLLLDWTSIAMNGCKVRWLGATCGNSISSRLMLTFLQLFLLRTTIWYLRYCYVSWAPLGYEWWQSAVLLNLEILTCVSDVQFTSSFSKCCVI